MKYIKRISIITTIILTVMCLVRSSEVKASNVEDLKQIWYETHYYPINPESREWKKYGLEEMLDILNPPEDLLHSFSTEELAELMMDYPYLWVLTSYEYDKMDIFWTYIENCNIYNELMSREDGVLCLLKEYQKSDFDINLCNEDPYMVWGYNPKANAEVFGCKFIVYNINNFDKEEHELCQQVMREKTELYSALNDNIAKQYLSFVKEQPVIRTVTAEEVKEQWYDTRYYPFASVNEKWLRYDDIKDSFTVDVMNPPPDLLISMSTEELAELIQEYPLMGKISYSFDGDGKQDYAVFFSFLEANCDIFYELLRREDGISCLLEKYRTNQYVDKLINTTYSAVDMNKLWLAELFGCQFISYYAHSFTEYEYELASKIIEEKKKQYLKDYRLSNYLDVPEIERPTGVKMSSIRTNYLRPEEIQEKEEKLAAALLQMKSKDIGLPTVTPDIKESSKATTAVTGDNSLQTATPGTEDSNIAYKYENNENIMAEQDNKAIAEEHEVASEYDETAAGVESAVAEAVGATTESVGNESRQQVIIAVGVLFGVMCVIGGFIFIRRKRKKN